MTASDQLLADCGHSFNFRLCTDIQAVMASTPLKAILLTHEAAQVPGLQRMLQQQLAVPVRGLQAGAAALGLASAWPHQFEQVAPNAVAYHTRRDMGEVPGPPAPREGTTAQPTHVLLGQQAHPLHDGPLFIDRDQDTGKLTIGGASGLACLRLNGAVVVLEVQAGAEIEVNGAKAEGQVVLELGAEISVGGSSETIKLIALTL